ncbi:TetR family transcriptional regulator [Mycobacterium sp. ACS4331]|uniref:TetR family transcriptional regulator n=1 Tax=Mycobacterium sp. ACS4331 TaxID=1834121 RepID=UPI0008019930|nr:TetR family transcriptional regulator [Mycobacterium sp. ACS4331]OBF27415.1 TetR family transcriptional regulator [Mycobacterium sp. ACS4331]
MAGKPDLRARRRRQTTADIRDAAIDLVRTRGFDGVTVEEICAAAGVAPRTFFNYFPNKESAIASGPPELPGHLTEGFIAAGAAPYVTVFTELITLVADHLADAPGRHHAVAVLEIAATTPVVQAAMLAGFQRGEREIAGLVARRCGLQADDEIPTLMAALVLTTVRAGMARWASAQPAPEDGPVPFVQQAARTVRHIFES